MVQSFRKLTLASSLFVFMVLVTGTADAQFAAPQTINTATAPFATPGGAATGDLNGDGRPDVVMPSDHGLEIYYSTPSGYGYPLSIWYLPCYGGAQAVAVADMDGDGWSDVVATCRYSSPAGTQGALVVLWGVDSQGNSSGLGDMTSTPIFPSGNAPVRLAVGDFRGQGRNDVVVARADMGTSEGERMALYTNNGDRTFSPNSNVDLYALGNIVVRAMVAADFNNDGVLDIAVASDVKVIVFYGGGSSTMATIPYPFGPNSLNSNWSIAAGDFDKDGRVDLVVGNGNGRLDFWRNAATVNGPQQFWNGSSWPFGNGMTTINFTAMGSISTRSTSGTFDRTPSYIAVADFNRDGWPDVASANTVPSLPYGGSAAGAVTVALGSATGFTEMAGSPIAVGNISPNAIVANDFDGDGLFDLLVPDSSGHNKPLVLTNTSSVLSTAPSSLTFWASAPSSGTISPAGIGINVNSSTVAASITTSANQPWINAQAAPGGSGSSTPFTVSVDASTLGPGTKRGTATVAASSFTSAIANITLNAARPSGSLTRAAVYTPTDRPYIGMVTGDVNGDGQTDFVMAGHTFISNGAGGFAEVVNGVDFGRQLSNRATGGDFNRDGKLDIAYVDGNILYVALGDGTGRYQNLTYVFIQAPTNAGTRITNLSVGDFNNDGFPDLIASDSASRRFLLFYGTSAGKFTNPVTIGAPSNPDCPQCGYEISRMVVGDFNGDGRLDFMFSLENSGIIIMTANASATGFSMAPDSNARSNNNALSYSSSNQNGYIQEMAVADMNADGIDDVIIGYANNQAPRDRVRVLLGNATLGAVGGGFTVGPQVALAQADNGAYGQKLLVADVNGDGKPDLVEMHAQSTTFVVARGDGLGGFSGTTTYDTQHPFQSPYGGGADYADLGAGDVNGDGKTDLLVLQTAATCTPTCATTAIYAFSGAIAATTTTINGAGGSAQFGQDAPVTVTVTAPAGMNPPTGNVSLKENGNVIATSQRSTPGVWMFTGIAVGTHTVTAQYDGDASNALSTSTAPATFTITRSTGAVSVTSNFNPTTAGDPVTFTATLSPVSAGGTMTFKDGTTTLGAAVVDATGAASFATTSLNVGTRSITAVFGGDGNVNPVTSTTYQQVVNPGLNAITLTGLSATYDGAPKPATAVTTPANLHVDFTYAAGACPSALNVSSTAPTATGSYCVTGTINDASQPTMHDSATGTLVISPAQVTFTISNVSQFFDGNPKPVTVTANPANVTYSVSYAGVPNAPSAIGTYAVHVDTTNPSYTGSATATLEISTKPATSTAVVIPGGVTSTTYGTPVTFWVTVNPIPAPLTGAVTVFVDGVQAAQGPLTAYPNNGFVGLQVTLTNGGGTHAITATYSGNQANASSQSAPLTQVVNKAQATLTLSNLSQTYAGTARSATATTNPAGLAVNVTYNNSPTVPVAVGQYAVAATINDPNYSGSATGTLTISAATGTAVYSGLVSAYDGQAHAVGVVTVPTVPVSITYQPVVNGLLTGAPTATAPVNAGTYRVVVAAASYTFPSPATDMVITKKGVSITLGNLSAIADGTPKPVSVVTNPAGINVTVTYTDGFMAPTTTPPTAQYLWTVKASVSDPNYAGSATATLDIHPKRTTATSMVGPATAVYRQTLVYTATTSVLFGLGGRATGNVVFKDGATTLGTAPVNAAGQANFFTSFVPGAHNITAVYSGDAENLASTSAVVTTTVAKATLTLTTASPLTTSYDKLPKKVVFTAPAYAGQLKIDQTYDGSSCAGTPSAAAATPPVNASATPYTVRACIKDPNYDGTATAQLKINTVPVTITLGSLSQTFSNTVKAATFTTNPANVPVALSYGGQTPIAAGTYAVTATSSDANYVGTATGTLTIAAAAAQITISNTTQTYDGAEKAVTVTTTPPLTYSVTYNGQPYVPSVAGNYKVEVKITQAGYTGSATGTLTINGKLTLATGAGLAQFYLDGNPVYNGVTIVSPGTHTLRADDVQVSDTQFYTFYSWGGIYQNQQTFTIGGSGSQSTQWFTVYADLKRLYTPGVEPAGTGTVTGGGYYIRNKIVTFTAKPAPGYTLKNWTYRGQTFDGVSWPVTLADSAEAPIAHFVPGYTVRASSASPERGSASVLPADQVGTGRSGSATALLAVGKAFQAYSVPKAGFVFDHWTVEGAQPLDENGLPVDFFGYQQALTRPNLQFNATSGQVSIVANWVRLEPEFEAEFGDLAELCIGIGTIAPKRAVPVDVEACGPRNPLILARNIGRATANNARITNVEITGVRVHASVEPIPEWATPGGFCVWAFVPQDDAEAADFDPCRLRFMPDINIALEQGRPRLVRTTFPLDMGNLDPMSYRAGYEGQARVEFMWPKLVFGVGNPQLELKADFIEYRVTVTIDANGWSGKTSFWSK